MSRYRIQIDPRLNARDVAFGARIIDTSVWVPERLAEAVAPYSLGDDAATFADFLASFPTAVAGALGLNATVVRESAGQLARLLSSEDEVNARPKLPLPLPVATKFAMPPLGASHPGLLKKS